MTFIDELKKRGDISFIGMRKVACQILSSKTREELDKLYDDLKRGKGILDDEEHLNMYLRSFGKMHKAKLDYSFQHLPSLKDTLLNGVSIYDWGCGQGTAIECLLDYTHQYHWQTNIKFITLIEPSADATNRALKVLDCYKQKYGYDFGINVINKVFDDLQKGDIPHSEGKKIHLFSNILDVDFDLARFTHLFQSTCLGDNLFICVGPYYSNSCRMMIL